MANPTTYYGFVLPTPTDLVTDLPADFDVALQGVDTRLKALQPGTTLGDIAYSSATANTNTRLGIGSNGDVLTVAGGVPTWATPAGGSTFVGVKLFLPAAQTIANATATAVAFGAGSESIDTDAFHDTSSNNTRITIPAGKGGKYLVIAAVSWGGNAVGVRELWVQKGASGRVMNAQMNIPGSAVTDQTALAIVDLAATDYIQMYVEQSSGGNLNAQGAFNFQTRFEAYLIGA